jgi:trans-AT polyketide synthase/acyltransferase/oxidoreductase domain-containing protein
MLTYVFAGQGSQRRGMGAALFDAFPEEIRVADAVLGYSITELCLEDPRRQLSQTQYTQPALYVVNALGYLKRRRDGGPAPDFLAGHSLGEYNALMAAGVFDFGTGLQLVKKRGELMAQASGGGMAAVLGLDEAAVLAILRDAGLERIDLANLNTPTQVVLAGPKEDVARAQGAFEARGARFVPLNVSAAFHSRAMQDAKDAFAAFLEPYVLRDPRGPVIANATARPYEPGAVKRTLAEQLRSPVRWNESIRYLLGRGATDFEEIGDARILTKMIQQIRDEAGPLPEEPPRPAPRAVVGPPQNPAVHHVGNGAAAAPSPPSRPPAFSPPMTPPSHSNGSGVLAHRPVALHNGGTVARAVGAPTPEALAARIAPETLGSAAFRKEYGVRYAYAAGAMYRAIASEDLVARMARARLLAFFGTAGLTPARVEKAIDEIRARVPAAAVLGMNLLSTSHEAENVEVYLRKRIDLIEASAYVQVTPALVKYRLRGLSRLPNGEVGTRNRVIGKVSRPEIAEAFLSPAPERIVKRLLDAGEISAEQAELAGHVPLVDDLCVEADSGGHTDQGVAYVLMPTMLGLRDEMARRHRYRKRVRVGAAGGLGTPEAAAAALMLGAEFLVTGSINQCSVEAGHSEPVKDLLEKINVQDTDYAPAGDMFETGARVQVLKKGVFFPARANRLYQLYTQFDSLDALDAATRRQLEEKYFKRSFEAVFDEVRQYKPAAEIERAERDPKYKMRLVFKWYFAYTNRLAFAGDRDNQIDFQVHCGPALGAFNQWVKGTALSSWRNRHVDDMAERLMTGTAAVLGERIHHLLGASAA